MRKPLIVSVRPERDLCGVSYWGKHLEGELRGLGVDVQGMTHKEFLNRARAAADALVLHVEIGTDTKNGDFLRALSAMAVGRIPRARRVSVVHSVFTPQQLQLSGPLAHVAVAYQWQAYRMLRRLTTIVTLSDTTHLQLEDRGIPNVGMRPGIYTSYLASGSANIKIEKDRLLIGLIGHPYGTKQYDLAVDAFALLPAEARKRARIVVLGGDPSFDPNGADRLRRSLGRLTDEERIVTGAISEEEFTAWLEALDIAVMPYVDRTSSSAVYSRVVGHNVPALTTTNQLFQPLIAAGGALPVDGWPQEASIALNKLIHDEQMRADMRAGAARLADAESVRSIAERFLSIMGLLHASA